MFSYTKEDVQLMGKFGVDPRHRWRSGETRMKPDPSGEKDENGKVLMIPAQDVHGAYQYKDAGKSITELIDRATGLAYIECVGTDHQDSLAKCMALLPITPKPLTGPQQAVADSIKATETALSAKDDEIAKLKAQLASMGGGAPTPTPEHAPIKKNKGGRPKKPQPAPETVPA